MQKYKKKSKNERENGEKMKRKMKEKWEENKGKKVEFFDGQDKILPFFDVKICFDICFGGLFSLKLPLKCLFSMC